jgi:hypothetical protein
VYLLLVRGDVPQDILSSLPSPTENDGMFTSSADLEVGMIFFSDLIFAFDYRKLYFFLTILNSGFHGATTL